MKSIQALLIVLCLLAAVFGSVVFRSRLGYRLLAAFFFVSASVFVFFPDLTSKIANALGVGRGADLLLYLGLVGGIHCFLLLYLRTRRLERQITDQIRALALRDAQFFGAGLSNSGSLSSRSDQDSGTAAIAAGARY